MKEDKIEVGDYVRSISGEIDKVDALYGMIENTIHLENHKWQNIKNIVKYSKNIIDLLEAGDYVNEEEVVQVEKNWVTTTENVYRSKDIKSIVTKEQFKNIEYRLED